MRQNRINRVLAALKEMNLEQALIVDPMSIYYLTDIYIQPMERFWGLYLNRNGRIVLILNRLFCIPEGVKEEQIWLTDTDNVAEAISTVVEKDKVLGVDKDLKARVLLPLIEMGAAAGFVNASLAVDETRGCKDSEEQELMRRVSLINDQAMGEFVKLIHEGVTEEEVAAQLEQIYVSLGAEGHSFSPIVSFGKNAADPHHEPDKTVLKKGDCVLFDVGCIKDGYCADMTRTFFYQEVSEQAREVYETVKRANEEAEAMIRAGIEIRTIDQTARNIISAKGYGENFTHRLGHFIGMTVHEFGDVSSANTNPAKPGMIFSIEPGIYLSNEFGVRIEDLVCVTEDGVERLNHYPKELQIIE